MATDRPKPRNKKTPSAKTSTSKSRVKKIGAVKQVTKRKGKTTKGSSPLRHATSYTFWVVLAIVAAIFLFFIGKLITDNAFVIRARFGEIVYPEGDVRGIDISHYQQDIDWDRVRNAEIDGVPIRFVFIKATEGADLIDENFNHNFYHARGNGFLRGAYHFFSTKSDPILQARHFCKIVQLDSTDMAPVLDVETHEGLSAAQLRRNVLRWMDYVENYYQVTPILYASSSFRKEYLNTPEFDRYPFWIAHYYIPKLKYKGEWKFWQHSDRGRIDGIDGHVDLNVFNGTYEELLALRVGNHEDKEGDGQGKGSRQERHHEAKE